MDLNAAEMFVHVVQAGSLSGAAERSGVPLPTLSRRIRALERELNVQLLERSARGTKLTDAGMRLYEHASRGIELLTDARQAVLNDEVRLKGRLRLSVPPAFEPWWRLLDAFQLQYPGIRISVYTTERQVDLIQDGIDVALRVGAIIHESMVARRILGYSHLLVAAPALLERLGTPRSPADLHRFPCAVWSADLSSRRLWTLGGHRVEPLPMLTTNDYLHLRDRALAGHVITELPPFLAASGIETGLLVPLLPSAPMPEQEIHLLYPSHRHPSSLVRAYLDFCRQRAAEFVAPAGRKEATAITRGRPGRR